MKPRSILATVIAVTLILTSLTIQVHPAAAATASVGGDCNQVAVTFYGAVSGTTYTIEENGVIAFSSSAVSGTVTFTRGAPLGGSVTISASESGVVLASATFNCGGAVTVFNPGDKSVSRAAGDRIAIYCNVGDTPPNIDVWGINNQGKGSRLAQISYTELVAAGTNGLVRNLGSNGVLYAGVAGDGKTFWFSRQGGPYNATGKGDFAKTVTCAGFKK
ncbi:MAG: hypothetical protein IT324_08875 [Anaerolineae bacterium]|nr:hypothetical protein [Anaerolineae bacterium]